MPLPYLRNVISSKLFHHYSLQDEDKENVESLGAGPLLPVRGAMGILEKALMPFVKKLKQPKHLGARQPSSAVDDRIVLPLHDVGEGDNGCKVEAEPALDDRVDTFTVRGRIPFVQLRLSLGLFYDYPDN